MRCEEVMKRNVVCALDNDTIESAAQKMRDENIGFLPVCDASGKVLGTITDRDICIRIDAEGRSSRECHVSDAMSREVVACRKDDDLSHVEQLMGQNHKSRMLVTDEGGRIQGVISLSDIAERDTLRRAAATLREVTSREARY
jgi:CBS domain-containing protein